MNTILRAYRVELDPTAEQRRYLERAAGVARAAYNWTLANWRRWYAWHKLHQRGHEARARKLILLWGGEPPVWDASKPPNAMALHAELTEIKREQFPWMAEVTAFAVREAVGDVGKAYDHFFRRLREGAVGREAGAPRFRAKRANVSWHADQGSALRTERRASGDRIYLGGLGWIKAKRGGYLPSARFDASATPGACCCTPTAKHEKGCPARRKGKQKDECACAPTAQHAGHCPRKRAKGAWVGDPGVELCAVGFSRVADVWYAAVRARVPAPAQIERRPGSRMGVEVGVRSLAVTSSGHRFGAVRDLQSIERAERRLKLWQRRAARRLRRNAGGVPLPRDQQSAGWHEATRWERHYHALVARCRADLLHKTSRAIVDTGNETIVMRDMAVKQMLRRDNKRTTEEQRTRNALAPMVAKVGMYELRRQVEYKQQWAGGKTVTAPSDHPTTRTCSSCGTVRDSEPPYPSWTCSACGATHDRETNAAVNLKNYTPSSDGDAAPGGTRPEKTSNGTIAERTGTPGAEEQSSTDGPDVAATSPHGSGNPAPASAGGKRAVRRHATEMPTGNGGRHATDHQSAQTHERSSDARGDLTKLTHGCQDAEAQKSTLSQTAPQGSGIAGGTA